MQRFAALATSGVHSLGGSALRARFARLGLFVLVLLPVFLSLQTLSLHRGLAAGATGTPPNAAMASPGASPTDTASPATAAATSTRVVAGTAAATATSEATATPALSPSVTTTPTVSTGPVREPTPPRHYVVVIVIDAGRASYYSLAQLPHIRALMRRGVVYNRAWVGELMSSTPDVHVTLGTGTLPRENGFMGFGWADPMTKRTIDFRTLLANHAIDPVLNNLAVPSIATRLHQFIPKAISVVGSGHKDYAAVGLGGGSADYELYGRFSNTQFVPTFLHAPPPLSPSERASLAIPRPLPVGAEDTWAFKYAGIVALHVRPRLLMLNVPEIDTWGHWQGPTDTPLFRKLMTNIDRGIGRIEAIYRRLGLLNRTDFIITSDHAMMQSHAAHNWGPVQVAAGGTAAGVARADGDGGAIWLKDPTQAKAGAERVVAMRPQHVEAVFYRSRTGNDYTYLPASPLSWLVNQQAAAALQYLVNTTAGQNGPDIWVLYRENYTVVPRNVQGTWKGTHGGPTWKVQHIPLILSGPGIRVGAQSSFGARSIDLTPTIERLLGLPPIRRDGVILADALVNPTKFETDPQQAIAPTLAADVEGLQAQSTYDSAGFGAWPLLPPPVYRCKLPPSATPVHQVECKTTPYTATNR